jgi:hypothetical protein
LEALGHNVKLELEGDNVELELDLLRRKLAGLLASLESSFREASDVTLKRLMLSPITLGCALVGVVG